MRAAVYYGNNKVGIEDVAPPTTAVIAPGNTFATGIKLTVTWTASDAGSGVATTAVRWARAAAPGVTLSDWTALSIWLVVLVRVSTIA